MNRWETQSEDSKTAVRVSIGYDRDTGSDVTEFILVDKTNGEKDHRGYDLKTGNRVF